jgi:hypothetical protein
MGICKDKEAPLLKGAVSLMADWRFTLNKTKSESHHRLRAVPLKVNCREAAREATLGSL